MSQTNTRRCYQTLADACEVKSDLEMDSSSPKSHLWTKGVTGYLLFAIFFTTIGPLQFGFHLAELNAPQEVITCKRKSIQSENPFPLPQCIPMNPLQFGLVSSIFTLGGLIGALSGGPISTKYGRLLTMRCTAIFFVLGPILEALATTIFVFSAGRFLSGIGAGAAVVAVPIYISEISPVEKRGFFGSLNQVMINLGIVISQVLGYFLSHGNYWRVVLIIGGAIGAFQSVTLIFVVESPKFMALRGDLTTARRNLSRIRGRNADVNGEILAWNVNAATTDPEEEGLLDGNSESVVASPALSGSEEHGVGILEAAVNPKYRPAIIAVVAVMAAQQLCGINSIVMYSVSLLSALLPTTAALLTVMVSGVNLFISILCVPLPDKIGRKPCLLISIAGMGTNSILLAFGIMFAVPILSIIATILFVASFAIGLGAVPFLLATELVGHEAVGAAQSWALASSWISTFAVAQFFPILNAAMGKGQVYFIFATLAACFFGFVWWWVPESSGDRDIDEIWGRN